MNNFPLPSISNNLAGIQSFSFIESKDVLHIPVSFPNAIHEELTFSAGASFHSGYSTAKTLAFTENMQFNSAGSFFNQKLIGFYPTLNPEAFSLFAWMQNRKFLVKVKDHSGLLRLVGTLEQPCSFSYNPDSGKVATDRRGVSFEFVCDNIFPAFFIH